MSNKRRARHPQTSSRADTVAIGYIHPGQVSSYFTESLVATIYRDVGAQLTGQRPTRIRNLYQEWSSANVSHSRNIVTARFVDRDEADWLLWIDADMQWAPDAVDRLLAYADPLERPIVGGLCFGMQDGRPLPTIYQWARVPGKEHPTTVRLPDYPRDSLVRCAATGAAFVLIHRSVLVAMRDAHLSEGDAFPWFQETSWQGDPVGEDITFCLRAGSLGFPTHVATDVRIGHHKSHLLTEDLFDSTIEREPTMRDGYEHSESDPATPAPPSKQQGKA